MPTNSELTGKTCLQCIEERPCHEFPWKSLLAAGESNTFLSPMQLASGCMWIWFANSKLGSIGFLRALWFLLHLQIGILPYFLTVRQSTLIHCSPQGDVYSNSIPRMGNPVNGRTVSKLSWVELKERITFKILVLVYKCLTSSASGYSSSCLPACSHRFPFSIWHHITRLTEPNTIKFLKSASFAHLEFICHLH